MIVQTDKEQRCLCQRSISSEDQLCNSSCEKEKSLFSSFKSHCASSSPALFFSSSCSCCSSSSSCSCSSSSCLLLYLFSLSLSLSLSFALCSLSHPLGIQRISLLLLSMDEMFYHCYSLCLMHTLSFSFQWHRLCHIMLVSSHLMQWEDTYIATLLKPIAATPGDINWYWHAMHSSLFLLCFWRARVEFSKWCYSMFKWMSETHTHTHTHTHSLTHTYTYSHSLTQGFEKQVEHRTVLYADSFETIVQKWVHCHSCTTDCYYCF